MPKRLAPERREHVIADVVRRLERTILALSHEFPSGTDCVVAAVRRLMAAGGPIGDDGAARLPVAAAALREAREAKGGMETVAAWVIRFCDPMSGQALPGLTRLWTRAVDQLRDRERQQRLKGQDSPVVTARLTRQHRQMLADIRLARTGLSTAEVVGHGIERQHLLLRQRSRKSVIDGPGLFDPPEG